MLEIEKYIKKHVGRKVLLTLTFSPSPNVYMLNAYIKYCYKNNKLEN